jgi:hypothetical protein
VTFEEALAHALTLPGTERSTSYGQPAAKANGRAFLNIGHEPGTSFVLQLDEGVIAYLLDAHPETFWKTAHYEDYPAVLVRYDTPHDALVREMIESACARAKTLKPPRPRQRKA